MDAEVRAKLGFNGCAFSARKAWVKETAIKVNEIFFNCLSKKTKKEMSGIFIGGNGPLKYQLSSSPFLKTCVKDAILCVMDTFYGGQMGFEECVRNSSSVLQSKHMLEENEVIEGLMEEISEHPKMFAIGFSEVLKAIEMKAVSEVTFAHGYHRFMVVEEGKNEMHFVQNRMQAENICNAMKNGSISNLSAFVSRLCFENKLELKVVGVHSPIINQFAKGFQSCVAKLYFVINYDFDEDDEENWM